MSSHLRKVRFGGFELDLGEGRLHHDGAAVKVRHQTLRLLCHLVAHRGQILSRADLARHLWGGADIDYDDRLNAAIRDLRKSLGDDKREAKIVQTIPRQGYVFAAKITEVRPFPKRLVAGTVAAVAALAGAYLWWDNTRHPSDKVSISALDRYVEAHALLDAGKRDEFLRARNMLQAVVTEAPDFADGWWALAKANLYLAKAPSEIFPPAKQAADRALAIDPDHVGALLEATTIAITWDRDWPAAESYVRRALSLAPDDARVYHSLSSLLYLRGDIQQGEETLLRGLAIDPLSVVMNADLAWYRTVSGDYDRAIETCDLIAQVNPPSQSAMFCALHPNLLRGRIDRAAAIARAMLGQNVTDNFDELSDHDTLTLFWNTTLQNTARAREQQYVDPVSVARVHAHLGDPGGTLVELENAVAERSMFAPYIHLFPEFRGLHGEPRFLTLLAKIGLPDKPEVVLAQLRARGVG